MSVKFKTIASDNGLTVDEIEEYVNRNKIPYQEGFTGSSAGFSVSEDDAARIVDGLRAEYKVRLEAEKQKAAASANILISSGFSFEGYRIVKYSGYISGDDVVEIPREGSYFFKQTGAGCQLTDALVKIRRQALKELKSAAYDLGCNAVIGVDFDYITMEPETANGQGGTTYYPYVICVTANGNAVVIEKDEW